MLIQDRLDRLANLYNKTKEPRYKEVRKNYGSNNIKRWVIPINSRNEKDVGGNRTNK